MSDYISSQYMHQDFFYICLVCKVFQYFYLAYNIQESQKMEDLFQLPKDQIGDKIINNDISLQESKTFQSAGLNSYLVKCYNKLKYHRPTPIQYYSISTYLQTKCRSIVAQSKSGTGKTLSYISILLSDAIQSQTINKKCSYLIILPTRELSLQVYQTFKLIINIIREVKAQNDVETKTKNKLRQMRIMMCIGGIPFEDDRRSYNTNGGTVLVGTIGRIIQFFDKKLINMNELEMLILDQGDKLFENKHKKFNDILDNIMRIKSNNDYKVQVVIYSATFTSKLIKQLHKSRQYTFIQTLSDVDNCLKMKITDKIEDISNLDNIVDQKIESTESIINLNNIKKYKVIINPQNQSIFNTKCKVLIQLLKELKYQRCLVFVEKKMLLEQINERMIQSELQPLLIHGSLSQSSRIKMMNQINRSKIVVASDLLARGIDLELDLVILFDAKKNDTFWHRIGRTGRYGSMGVAISLDQISGWKQYDKEEVQKYLDEISNSFDKNKQWYGTYMTQVGQWNVTNQQKQLKLQQEFKYFDEQKFKKGRKMVKTDQISVQSGYKCALNEDKLMSIKSKQQLTEVIRQLVSCSKCMKFMQSITNLTGYKFKLTQMITNNF